LHRWVVDGAAREDASRAARSWSDRHLAPPVVAAGFAEIVKRTLARRPLTIHEPVRTARGVTVIGDPHATTGLMEVGRAQLRQLVQAGADVSFDTKIQAAASHSLTRHIDELAMVPQGRHHLVELWQLNLNEFLGVPDDVLRPPGDRRYVIASWFWEMPVVPVPYTRETQRPDEIWVPTRFVQQAISPYTARPVHIVPPLVDVPLPPRVERHDFGLPDDGLLFFFNLDANSTVARKNPWAVVQAFMRAFDEGERERRARLVLKCTHLERHAEAFAELQAALKAANGILLADELERLEMNALLASIDVYVSMHRSEGFGLGMAEAMFLGKPVIGTAYSGSADFMTPENSCQVGYRMRPITTADHRFFPPAAVVYQPGIPWADADVDQAARWMRRLFEHPRLRVEVGERGAHTIREKYSFEVTQRALVTRLEGAWRAFEGG
jgi:glycosyltransferase involved in cell wall biosynthesis